MLVTVTTCGAACPAAPLVTVTVTVLGGGQLSGAGAARDTPVRRAAAVAEESFILRYRSLRSK